MVLFFSLIDFACSLLPHRKLLTFLSQRSCPEMVIVNDRALSEL